jgi:hypothetical protein
MACNLAEGWARDVSESIAREIAKVDDDLLTAGTRACIDRLLTHSGATDTKRRPDDAFDAPNRSGKLAARLRIARRGLTRYGIDYE